MSFFSSLFKPLVSIAAPVAGFALSGGNPLGAALGGGLGGLLSGGGFKGAATGALTGGLGGALAGGLGSVAGSPVAGGIGPTQGSGILGGLTRSVPSLAAPLNSLGSSFGGGSMFGGSSGRLGGMLTGALTLNAAEKAKDDWMKQINRAGQEFQPYQQAGLAANQRLSDMLANGQLGGRFTADRFQQDPGYQFRLAEGQNALNRRLAAGGNYFSGNALKAANDYAQNMASQEYQNAFNRNQSEEQNLYNMLYGQQGRGATSAAQLAELYGDEARARDLARGVKTNSLAQILGGFL